MALKEGREHGVKWPCARCRAAADAAAAAGSVGKNERASTHLGGDLAALGVAQRDEDIILELTLTAGKGNAPCLGLEPSLPLAPRDNRLQDH